MLLANSVDHRIGHTQEEIDDFLASRSCPEIPSFVNYLRRFAGLRFEPELSVLVSGASFRRIDARLRLSFDKQLGQWRMFLGETDCGVGLNLLASGQLFMARYSGSCVVISDSLDTFVEQCALVWSARKQKLIVDRVSTSMIDGAEKLADRLGLQLVPRASDDHGKWWRGNSCGLGLTPFFERRFLVTGYWDGSDRAVEDRWTDEMTALLEPFMGLARGTDAYRRYRDSGDTSGILEFNESCSGPRPADSFRSSVRAGISDLGKGIVEPPPADEADLGDYCGQQIRSAKSRGNSLLTYYLALGQLAFGEIDALPDVLDNLPLSESSAWGSPLWGGAFLEYLFPGQVFPDPIENTENVRKWFDACRDALVWNESRGVYF